MQNGAKKVVVVDPDSGSRRALRSTFESEGYDVLEFGGVVQVVPALAERSVDLVTLEPGESECYGLAAIRRLRALTNAPLMIVSDKGETVDMVLAFELGADDYLRKPFNTHELVARSHALMRRVENGRRWPSPSGPAQVAFGNWVMDLVRRELHRRDGAPRDLTGSEFDLLSMFVRAPNRVLTRDQIMAQLRGRSWSPFERAVDMLVRRVRQKIEDDPSKPRLIKTVRSAGYLFSSEVELCA